MRSIGVIAVVVALCSVTLAREARASEHDGRTACGAYKLRIDDTRLSGTLCDGRVTVRGTTTKIESLTFKIGSMTYELAADVPAPDPKLRATVEAFARSADRLRTVAQLLEGSDDPSLAQRLFNSKTMLRDDAPLARAGADVGCTDLTDIAVTMGVAAYIDHESALSYRAYYVPPHCTVIVDGTVDVGELRVDGMLVRLGGGIKADTIAGGLTGGIGLGRIFVTGEVNAKNLRLHGIKLSAGAAVTADTIDLARKGGIASPALVRFRSGEMSSEAGLSGASLELESLALATGAHASAGTFFGPRRTIPASTGPTRIQVDRGATASSGGEMTLTEIRASGGKVTSVTMRADTIIAQQGGLVRASQRLDAARVTVTDNGRLSGGHVVVNALSLTRGSANVSILESPDVRGRDAGIRVRQRMTVRASPGLVSMVGGALVVSTQALDPDDPANAGRTIEDAPTEPEGPPAFDACLATPAGLDVETLSVDNTDVSVRHSKITTLRARRGSYRPVRVPGVRGVPRATMCLEVTGEATLDGTYLAASRLYAAFAKGQLLGKTELTADEGGDLPRTGKIHINTEDHPLATGASFGGYGGSSGALAGNYFDVADAPVDDPRTFREGGLGGQGGDASALANGYAAGFPGAGVIRVVASDLVVDGRIHADGRTFPDGVNGAGGGSGGSIVLALTGNLSGKGSITAHGGDGGLAPSSLTGGGGSGGRIRIEHATRTGWRGKVLAFGGLGGRHDPRAIGKESSKVPPWSHWTSHGGPGTVYWKPTSGVGQVVIEGPALVRGRHRGVGFVGGDLSGDEIVIKNAFVVSDGLRAASLTIAAGGVFTADEPRLRLEWPATRPVFSAEYPDALHAGWGGIDQVGFAEAIWQEPLEETLAIALTGDLTVAKGGRLDMTGVGGYGRAEWLGANSYPNRAGGSHGGHGGTGRFGKTSSIGRVTDATGDPLEPTTFGEGGWGDTDWNQGKAHAIGSMGGAGGGVLRVEVAGTTRVDGAISANGAPGVPFFDAYNYHTGTGGGAGGSVWLTTAALAGRGTISADGGAGTASPKAGTFGGGGGGGRVRIDTASAPSASWRGNAQALGGKGGELGGTIPRPPRGAAPYTFAARFRDPRYDGGPGTVYWKPADAPGTLVIDGTRGGRGTGLVEGKLPADRVGTVELRGAYVMAYTPFAAQRLVLARGAVLSGFDRRVRLLRLADPALPVDALTLGPSPFPTTLAVTVAGDVSIDRTSRIDVSGLGDYGRYACLRSCSFTNRAGGSHGARGGQGIAASAAQPGEPSPARGDAAKPVTPGEGGWSGAENTSHLLGYDACTTGGSGGGALALTVGGTLELAGRIAADGDGALPRTRCPRRHDAGGGGAGGSILLDVATFSGRGTVSARGGGGVATAPRAPTPGVGGGGSGGRVSLTARTCDFRGTVTVTGGGSEAGTGTAANAFTGAAGTVSGGCPR